ncbi:MAG: aminoglycoside phosphotransferase family protein [Candidatus Dormibacteraceae bacterium]
MSITLPANLITALHRRLGSTAQQWLDVELPSVLARCQTRWNLTVEGVIDGGATAAIFAVRQTGNRPAVLKILPELDLAAQELLGWQLWSGRGLPRLLDYDLPSGVLLQERVLPGTSLLDPSVKEASAHAARLLQQLMAVIVDRPLPPLVKRVDGRLRHASELVREGENAVSEILVLKAARLSETLLADQTIPTALHGDYFPDNILWSDTQGWMAIDPQPCFGDSAFDAGTWCYAYQRGEHVSDHATVFATTLGIDIERIIGWARVVAITNLAWRFACGHASEREVVTSLAFATIDRGSYSN